MNPNSKELQQQINDTRRLLANASRSNNANSVFRLLRELDRLVDMKYQRTAR